MKAYRFFFFAVIIVVLSLTLFACGNKGGGEKGEKEGVSITGLDPASGYNDEQVPINIFGLGFNPNLGFRAFLGNVELANVFAVSPEMVRAEVPAEMEPGVYDLQVVMNSSQEANLPAAYEVLDASALSIEAIIPSWCYEGETPSVGIKGSGFSGRIDVLAASPEIEVSFTEMSVQSLTRLSARVPADLPAGVYDLVVIRNGEEEATLEYAFEVKPQPSDDDDDDNDDNDDSGDDDDDDDDDSGDCHSNLAYGKPVTYQASSAWDGNPNGQIGNVVDGSLAPEGSFGLQNADYSEPAWVEVTIDLGTPHTVFEIRYHTGDVERADTWVPDRMISSMGEVQPNPGSPWDGAWTSQAGVLVTRYVTVRFEKTRTAWAEDWMFIGEIKVIGCDEVEAVTCVDIPGGDWNAAWTQAVGGGYVIWKDEVLAYDFLGYIYWEDVYEKALRFPAIGEPNEFGAPDAGVYGRTWIRYEVNWSDKRRICSSIPFTAMEFYKIPWAGEQTGPIASYNL